MPDIVTKVLMPQMGESITEATISAWRKNVGDYVEEGEALLDISTAKIESEIPAPSTGIIVKLLHSKGETVPVDTVIAFIAPDGADLSALDLDIAPALPAGPVAAAPVPTPSAAITSPAIPARATNGNRPPAPAAVPAPEAPARVEAVTPKEIADERTERLRHRSTPLVRNIAQDLGIHLEDVKGTGTQGRVTKRDLENHIAEQKKQERAHGGSFGANLLPAEQRPESRLRPGQIKLDTVSGPFAEGLDIPGEHVPVSMMRRMIAENLTRSSQTIPHAYTCHEVDFTQLEKLRLRYRGVFETQFGTRLTPLVFLVSAIADALLRFPSINATWAGDKIVKHRVVNIGIAVALREGLVVPVLKNVEGMSLAGIARGLVDLGARARANQLKMSDMEGGTFTITSPGQLGATFAIPIIMPPQGGIIHLGAIQKVPCVVTGPDGQDSIAIRQRAMMTLGIDHRLIDGWEADQFMIAIKERIERADFGLPA